MTTATRGRSSADEVRPGDVFSRASSGTIVGCTLGSVTVRNDQGFEWQVSDEVFEAEFTVATQFADKKTVTQTKLIELIEKAPRTAMTIHFRKKAKPADVTAALRIAAAESGIESRKFASAVKEAVAGEPRTMIGRHFSDHDERGRLRFIEAEGKGLRLIDTRTVEFAIIDNVKYEVA